MKKPFGFFFFFISYLQVQIEVISEHDLICLIYFPYGFFKTYLFSQFPIRWSWGVKRGMGCKTPTTTKSKTMIVSAAELFVLTLAVQVFIVVHSLLDEKRNITKFSKLYI